MTLGAPPLRVLHLFRYFRPDFTGEGIYLEKLAPHLAALGIHSEVAVAATLPSPPAGSLPGIAAVHRFVDPAGGRALGNLPLLAWLAANLRRYDVLHLHCMVDRLFLPHLLARLFRRRLVHSFTLEDSPGMMLTGYRPGARRAVAGQLCRLIQTGVAISPRLHADAARVLPPARLHLIPQGVEPPAPPDAASRAAARARFGFAASDRVLLYVGGLAPRKDVALLLAALPALAATFPAIRLLLVGPALDPAYAASLHRQAAALPPGMVVFTGLLRDPGPAYLAADAFVFASRTEGFGNVLLEAMAAGLPVLARRIPGVTDSFIADGRDGLLFDDAAGYAAALHRLLADPALAARLGAAARRSAGRYALAPIAGRYAALYRAASS